MNHEIFDYILRNWIPCDVLPLPDKAAAPDSERDSVGAEEGL